MRALPGGPLAVPSHKLCLQRAARSSRIACRRPRLTLPCRKRAAARLSGSHRALSRQAHERWSSAASRSRSATDTSCGAARGRQEDCRQGVPHRSALWMRSLRWNSSCDEHDTHVHAPPTQRLNCTHKMDPQRQHCTPHPPADVSAHTAQWWPPLAELLPRLPFRGTGGGDPPALPAASATSRSSSSCA
jgi:hypothetical protein